MEKIKLSIPKKAEYISIARLTGSGLGLSLNMNLEEIEDLKVSIGEACICVLESDQEEIYIEFTKEENSLTTYIRGVRNKDCQSRDRLGVLIIESLMDKVEYKDGGIYMTINVEDGLYGEKS